MIEKYVSVTVEYGHIEYGAEGSSVVFGDSSENFDVSDPTASFADLFDDLAFEVRNNLDA